MRGLWLGDGLKFREDLPVPEPSAGEARVAVRLAGICGTDLELVKGYYPFRGVLGHEFVGEIVEAPDAQERIGEHVVGEINSGCGSCDSCRSGRRTHCKRRNVLGIKNRDGAFADFLCLPLKNLIHVAKIIPDEAAVFTEPLAAALEILEQITIRPTDHVLLVGAGRLGQLIAQVLSLTGCNLQVVARYLRQQKLLQAHNISSIDEISIQNGAFDVAIEATGSPEGITLARHAVRSRGMIVLKSTYKGNAQLDYSSIVVDEINLVGSRCGPFRPALKLLESKIVNPIPLIDACFPLDKAVQALEKAKEPGVLKVLLQIAP